MKNLQKVKKYVFENFNLTRINYNNNLNLVTFGKMKNQIIHEHF